MRIAMIGCMVMNREICHLVAESHNIVRVWWLRQGLHETPDLLRVQLQESIDQIEHENELQPENMKYDPIILAYGLCSNGVLGLRSRSIPIVVPRCDDCISLFLGSADRYRQLFYKLDGVYWYNSGWIEQSFTASTQNYALRRKQYAEIYGEENADYLMECTNGWMKNYKCCGFITCPLGDRPEYEQYARQAAEDFHWDFVKIEGEMSYLDALVNGPWDDKRFLSCPPNSRIVAEYNNRKFRSEPAVLDDLEDWPEKESKRMGRWGKTN